MTRIMTQHITWIFAFELFSVRAEFAELKPTVCVFLLALRVLKAQIALL